MQKQFNVYSEHCRSRKIFELITDKWSLLIISMLEKNTYRFGDLKREVEGISQKVLTQVLRKLEANGFVSRVSYPVLPLKVEYSLTELGYELSAIAKQIIQWVEENAAKIVAISEANRAD